jgi:hypothetical protein
MQAEMEAKSTEEKILPRPAWLSIVGGVLSFVIVCTPMLGMYLAVASAAGGLLSGIQALRIIRSDPETYRGAGPALAGLALSSVALLVFVALLVLQIVGIALGGPGS